MVPVATGHHASGATASGGEDDFGVVSPGVEVPVGLGEVVGGDGGDACGRVVGDHCADGDRGSVDALFGEGVVEVVDPVAQGGLGGVEGGEERVGGDRATA